MGATCQTTVCPATAASDFLLVELCAAAGNAATTSCGRGYGRLRTFIDISPAPCSKVKPLPTRFLLSLVSCGAVGRFVFLWRKFGNFSIVPTPSDGGIMKGLVCALVVGVVCLLAPSLAEKHVPEVQVYSREPGDFGKPNILICHASKFHPPEIKIELLKNGMKIPKTNQTDLAFEESWYYHITQTADFTPREGEKYACRVTHMGIPKMYAWEDDM